MCLNLKKSHFQWKMPISQWAQVSFVIDKNTILCFVFNRRVSNQPQRTLKHDSKTTVSIRAGSWFIKRPAFLKGRFTRSWKASVQSSLLPLEMLGGHAVPCPIHARRKFALKTRRLANETLLRSMSRARSSPAVRSAHPRPGCVTRRRPRPACARSRCAELCPPQLPLGSPCALPSGPARAAARPRSGPRCARPRLASPRTPGPAQGPGAARPFPVRARCRATPGGPFPPGELGPKAGSEPEYNGSTPRVEMRLGPAGPLRAAAATAAAGATPYPAPGPGTARCSCRAEPGRAEPEPSGAEPNRSWTEAGAGRAERSRSGAERSRAARSSKQDGGRGPSCARTLRSNRRMFTVKFPPAPAPPLRLRAAPGGGAEPRQRGTAAEWQRRAGSAGGGASAGRGGCACAARAGRGRAVRALRPRSARTRCALFLARCERWKQMFVFHYVLLVRFSDPCSFPLLPRRYRCFLLWGILLSQGATAGTAHFLCLDQYDFDCILKDFLGPNLVIYDDHIWCNGEGRL